MNRRLLSLFLGSVLCTGLSLQAAPRYQRCSCQADPTGGFHP